MENIITIQSRFDVGSNSINATTRNSFCYSQVEVLREISNVLFPGDEIRFYFEVPKEGSYIDDLKLVGGTIAGTTAIVGSIYAALAYYDSRDVNHLTKYESCERILEQHQIDDLDQKTAKICESFRIQKNSNKSIEALIADAEVLNYTIKIKTDGDVLFEKKIKRNEFSDYIVPLEEEREVTRENLVGHIEIAQPYILKQTQYGQGKTWNGIYYGADILDNNLRLILCNGQDVDFYMQDNEYKDQVLNRDIKFESGDNIEIEFDLNAKFNILDSCYKSRKIYVKKVVNHNDDYIQHQKEELYKKRKIDKFNQENSGQSALF